eukprot:m.183558 g.183558  ORF g.183558 m.183558 type:complete len:191 (-) comp15844_c0_seq1:49-621(-)
MDKKGFTELLAELDDETVREMLIHVSANSPDALALILAQISSQRSDDAQNGAKGTPTVEEGDKAGPAVAGPAQSKSGRLWRSFSHEELVSESFDAVAETVDIVPMSTPMTSRTMKRPAEPIRHSFATLSAETPMDRSSSDGGSGGSGGESESPPRRSSGGRWWRFGGRRSKDVGVAKSSGGKRKNSKSTA